MRWCRAEDDRAAGSTLHRVRQVTVHQSTLLANHIRGLMPTVRDASHGYARLRLPLGRQFYLVSTNGVVVSGFRYLDEYRAAFAGPTRW